MERQENLEKCLLFAFNPSVEEEELSEIRGRAASLADVEFLVQIKRVRFGRDGSARRCLLLFCELAEASSWDDSQALHSNAAD